MQTVSTIGLDIAKSVFQVMALMRPGSGRAPSVEASPRPSILPEVAGDLRDGMKRWTNGLPGATKRLGANLALRGLSVSQPRMRADTHDGPEHNRSTSEA
jgi:hypothetical protein